jgi:hypothetical protein
MADRVICPECGHSNSKHRVTCKNCRASLVEAKGEKANAMLGESTQEGWKAIEPLSEAERPALFAPQVEQERQKEVEALSEAVTKELAGGKNKKEIVKELVKQGWSRETANEFVAGAEQAVKEYKRSPEGRRVLAEKHKKRMIRGLLWTIAGIVITALTYTAASEGGTYFICWGAILLGFIDFLVGLIGWLRYQ